MATAESRPHPTNLWTAADVQALPVSLRRYLDYCWTGPDVSGVGVTQIEAAVWAARIGEHQLSTAKALEILSGDGFVIFDQATMEVWVCRWFSFHSFRNPAGKNAFNKGLRQIRSEKIRAMVLEAAKKAGLKVSENCLSNKNNDLVPNSNPNLNSTEAEGAAQLSLNQRLDQLRAKGAGTKDCDLEKDRAAIQEVRDLAGWLGDEVVLPVIAAASYPSQALKACRDAGLPDAAKQYKQQKEKEEGEVERSRLLQESSQLLEKRMVADEAAMNKGKALLNKKAA